MTTDINSNWATFMALPDVRKAFELYAIQLTSRIEELEQSMLSFGSPENPNFPIQYARLSAARSELQLQLDQITFNLTLTA